MSKQELVNSLVEKVQKEIANYKSELVNDLKPSDNIGEDNQNRSFDLNASYTVAMTVPYCRNEEYLKGIEVYLNENLIFMHDGDKEIVPGLDKFPPKN